MADERSRAHERQAAVGDLDAAAAVLRERLRAGELTPCGAKTRPRSSQTLVAERLVSNSCT